MHTTTTTTTTTTAYHLSCSNKLQSKTLSSLLGVFRFVAFPVLFFERASERVSERPCTNPLSIWAINYKHTPKGAWRRWYECTPLRTVQYVWCRSVMKRGICTEIIRLRTFECNDDDACLHAVSLSLSVQHYQGGGGGGGGGGENDLLKGKVDALSSFLLIYSLYSMRVGWVGKQCSLQRCKKKKKIVRERERDSKDNAFGAQDKRFGKSLLLPFSY